MKKLYIHAGFPKCGSSSIQTFLSGQRIFYSKDGSKLIYAVLLGNSIVHGKSLCELIANNPTGYVSSLPWRNRKISIENYFDTVGDQLLNLLMNNHVILSQEAWIEEFEFWKTVDFFKKNEIEVTFICYIRPQIEWINSGWWQWGAWTESSLDNWINSIIPGVKYFDRIIEFINIGWIKQVKVRLLNRKLLSDFSTLLNLNDSYFSTDLDKLVNKGLPNSLLRLFQLHRQLRPGPHDAVIDSILTNNLQLKGKPAWVLDSTKITSIIRELYQNNKKLIEILDEDCRADFEADLRYWDAAAFESISKNVSPVKDVKPTYAELEEISLAAINSIVEIYNKQPKLTIVESIELQSLSSKLQSFIIGNKFRIFDVRNQVEWHKFATSSEYKQERWVENNVFIKPPIQFLGFCGICNDWKSLKLTAHHSTITPEGAVSLAYTETCVCAECNTNSRMRAAIELMIALGADENSDIYLTEQCTNFFKVVNKRFTKAIGSENLGDVVPLGKQNKDGYRNEKLQSLTFGNFSFDFLVCLDVLEHVPDPFVAINEILRVLRPDGVAILTFPFFPSLNVSIKRTELEIVKGVKTVKHLKPPVYHGNPVDPTAKSIVFYDLGFDIVEHAKSIAAEASLISYWSYRSGHFGPNRFMLVLKK